eukprot:CAMPEP_0115246186 /NCGR_PEP_ID=MMETSP0270-20121206/40894_1 /TAXON_ID=71861 /ORGANISM="Scrippsiella trochoidea, Strain CCMP3099" /LENGTH=127 /DNA_ID=CAMNT_0002661387 /DNA_START=1627 /DNA_END=2010 /DNA_ORIENTATION=+
MISRQLRAAAPRHAKCTGLKLLQYPTEAAATPTPATLMPALVTWAASCNVFTRQCNSTLQPFDSHGREKGSSRNRNSLARCRLASRFFCIARIRLKAPLLVKWRTSIKLSSWAQPGCGHFAVTDASK